MLCYWMMEVDESITCSKVWMNLLATDNCKDRSKKGGEQSLEIVFLND